MDSFKLAAVQKNGNGWTAYAVDVGTGETILLGTFENDRVADAVADLYIEGVTCQEQTKKQSD